MRKRNARWEKLLLLVCVGASACEPCSGIASCHVAPTIDASGQVIDYASGHAVAGAAVSFTPVGGAAISATSDALGQFQLSGAATADGTVTGDTPQ